MVNRPRVRLGALIVASTCCLLTAVTLLRGAPARTASVQIVKASAAAHDPATAHRNSATAHRGALRSAFDRPWPQNTSLDIALEGTATASTAATGSPASNAIDGNASTQWCSTQWTGSVTVDLGRVRSLDGLGLTLGDSATTMATIRTPCSPYPAPPSSRRRRGIPPTGRWREAGSGRGT
jgi:hypothetical protein